MSTLQTDINAKITNILHIHLNKYRIYYMNIIACFILQVNMPNIISIPYRSKELLIPYQQVLAMNKNHLRALIFPKKYCT